MARARNFPYEHGFTSDWRGWPPHMIPAERELLYWYINLAPSMLRELWYDVPLDGENARTADYPAAAEILNPTELRTWYALTARRADAVQRRQDLYTIIELRDRAGPQTLGETQIYDRLARDQYPELNWTRPLIIAREYESGILRCAQNANIDTLKAPDDLYDPDQVKDRYIPTKPIQAITTG